MSWLRQRTATARAKMVALFFLILFLFGVISQVMTGNTIGQVQASPISADVAVTRAIESLRYGDPTHDPVFAAPTQIRGKLMTFDEANQFVFSRPLSPNTSVGKERGKSVWLIALWVDGTSHSAAVPAARGSSAIPAKVVRFSLAIEILDATTGLQLMGSMTSPEQHPNVQSLPLLSRPQGTVVVPTSPPIQYVTPALRATPPPGQQMPTSPPYP